MKIICITEWSRLQHYKDRNPLWVKLYRDLMTSESWVLGTDLSRLVQVASVLLAARYGNQIPYRWDLLRKVSNLECTEKSFNEAVKHLAQYKFLEIQDAPDDLKSVEQDASTPLAKCLLREEERREEERREEEIDRCARPSRTPTASRLPADFALTPERRAVAEAEKADPEREFANFTDHWRAASGAKARKHDWDATWRIWCRRAPDFKPRMNGQAEGPPRTWRPDPKDDVPQMEDPYAS